MAAVDEPRLVAAATRALATGGRTARYWSVQLLAELAERHAAAGEALRAARSDEDGRVRRAVTNALTTSGMTGPE